MKIKKNNSGKVLFASLWVVSFLSLCALPVIGSEMSHAAVCDNATEACSTISLTIASSISITSATASASLGSASTSSVSRSSAQTVTVATNNGGGYYLTAKAISKDASGTVSNKLLKRSSLDALTATSSVGFTALTAKTAKSSIGAGYWGLSLDDSTYRPVATSSSGSGIIAYSTAPATSASTTLYYAAKGSTSMMAGDYSATIQYTAVANDGTAKTLYGD